MQKKGINFLTAQSHLIKEVSGHGESVQTILSKLVRL